MGNYRKVSYDRVCGYCGKPFVAHDARRRYCSKKCNDISYRLRNGISGNKNLEPFHKTCFVCGAAFETYREAQRTCSHECAETYHKSSQRTTRLHKKQPKEPKNCDVCGAQFIPRWDVQATCGDDNCKREHRKKYALAKAKEKALNQESTNFILTECKFCGDIFCADERAKRKYCSKECSRKAANKRHDKRIPKSQRVDNIVLTRLYERDGGKCYKCGCDCNFDDWRQSKRGNKYPGDNYPTIDHVVPVSLGGLDSWDNVRLACWKCNLEKADKIETIAPLEKSFAYSKQNKGQQPKRTAQYTLDGQLVRIWDSTAQIRRESGLNDKHIQSVCRRYKSNTGNAYGFHWEYIDEQNARCG